MSGCLTAGTAAVRPRGAGSVTRQPRPGTFPEPARYGTVPPAARYGWAVLAAVVAAGLLGGCGGPAPRVPDTGPGTGSGSPGAANGPGLVVQPDAAQADRALASLRRIDDHPLFEMTYDGPAPRAAGEVTATPAGPGAGTVTATAAPSSPAYGCTVFLAGGDRGRPVFGRNFDWDHNPALVLHARPPDGYASISLVDMSSLGFDATHPPDRSDAAGRRGLLRAPAVPFDGMNERGLAVAMAAEDRARAEVRPGRPRVGSLGIMRLVLDRAATVAEAVALFGGYTVDFTTGGPPLHYLVADATGNAAVIEYVDGRMRVLPGAPTWHLMTNFQLATTAGPLRTGDWRYRTASQRLSATGGRLDPAGALALLNDVAQPTTQWSLVYDLAARTTLLVTGRRYGSSHRFGPP